MTPAAATAVRSAPRAPAVTTPGPRIRLASERPAQPVRRGRVTLRPLGIAATLVVASLLAVVIGNMLLASGQLRLEQLQQRLAQVESKMAAKQELYQEMTAPRHVAISAERNGLVQPSTTYTLPYVADLSRRLHPLLLSSAPCCTITPRR